MAKRMNTGRAVSGGGQRMNKNVQPRMRPGPRSTNVISPYAVDRLGAAQGNHTTETGSLGPNREPLVARRAPEVPLGNDLARNVGKGGPGKGRTLYGQGGTNKMYGPVNPGNAPFKGREILEPPEMSGPNARNFKGPQK